LGHRVLESSYGNVTNKRQTDRETYDCIVTRSLTRARDP